MPALHHGARRLQATPTSEQFSLFRGYIDARVFIAGLLAHEGPFTPEGLLLGYNTCRVSYVTHAIDGLSDNDFICAAKADALL